MAPGPGPGRLEQGVSAFSLQPGLRALLLWIEGRELRCTQLLMILARVKPTRHWSARPDLLHNLILRRVLHDHLDAHNEVA